MFKSILTANINSQIANNGLFLPLSFDYNHVRLFGILSANKVDAEKIIENFNEKFGNKSNSEAPSDEEIYENVKSIVAAENKYFFPLTLSLIIIRESGKILILNWGGSVLLRRKEKIGQLTTDRKERVELEVKAGKLNSGDILALYSENSEISLEKIKENLEVAHDWTDFILFSQAYLSQPDLENQGLLIIKLLENQEKIEGENINDKEGEEDSRNIDSPAIKNEIIDDDMFDGARRIEQEIIEENHAEVQSLPYSNPPSEQISTAQIQDESIKKSPWNKIGSLFKKKT